MNPDKMTDCAGSPAGVRMGSSGAISFVYLPIEVRARELYPKIWLARVLVDHGMTCIIGDKGGISAARMIYPDGVYMEKSISRRKVEKLDQLADRYSVIVCQDEEAGIARSELAPFFDERVSRHTLSRTERFFTWGKFDYKLLSGRYPDLTDRLRVTGSPRIDIWRPELARSIFGGTAQRIVDRFGTFVLVNSSIGITSRERIDEVLEQKVAYGLIQPEERGSEKARLTSRYQEFLQLAKYIDSVATKFPDRTFVVRPHPAESVTDWKRALPEKGNVKVVKEGDVTPWILAANMVVHEGCTTAVQAVCMDKPVISVILDSERIGDKINDFPTRLGVRVESIEELAAAIDRIWRETDRVGKDEDKALVQERLGDLSGAYSAQKIADELVSLQRPTGARPSAWVGGVFRAGTYVRALKKVALAWSMAAGDTMNRRRVDKLKGGVRRSDVEPVIRELERTGLVSGRATIRTIGFNVIEIARSD